MSDSGAAAEAAATVLVVDDNHAGRYAKAHVFELAGFRVVEAATGADALRIVREQAPELVILDVNLPDINGIDVCRTLKADPASAASMVLQVSAYYTSAEDQVLGLDSGADAYLPGDVAPALLISAARALLRTRRAEQAVQEREQRLRLSQELARREQELQALAGMLLEVQEKERRRIARELHDDFSQRLALVEVELTALRKRAPALRRDIDSVLHQMAALSGELRDLSHLLHPSVLEDLGLESALRSLCEEFERTHNIATNCDCFIDDRDIPVQTATVLYRIVQEALRNVVKHAGDARVTIRVRVGEREVSLEVSDDGCGFNAAASQAKPALGIISMQERARLVGGSFEVRSKPGEGTTVRVTAPLPQVAPPQA